MRGGALPALIPIADPLGSGEFQIANEDRSDRKIADEVGCAGMDDCRFVNRHSQWEWMAAQTARRLERQIGRPESEFNRECLTQELVPNCSEYRTICPSV